jgi:hypothetical protein
VPTSCQYYSIIQANLPIANGTGVTKTVEVSLFKQVMLVNKVAAGWFSDKKSDKQGGLCRGKRNRSITNLLVA